MNKALIGILVLFCMSNAYGITYHVTPVGAGSMDGTSWANAASGNNLQAIIDAANPGDEVWVACGTYVPTTTTDRSISFSMRNGITIYGSFQGTESVLGDREFSCGPCSTLSGEIGAAGIADNSFTVIYNEELNNTAVIDGFEIRDGNDDRSPTSAGDGLGGGLYNHGYGAGGFCHPVVRNCVFTNNRASWGGGAFNNGYDSGDAEPTYINCIFYQNHAYIEAGGMDSYGVGGNASPTLYNCVFDSNTSASNVGAMYCWGGNTGGNCHPVLINCVFTNNTATNGYGGAFIADNLDENLTTSSGSCTVTLQNCIIWNNSATGDGPQFYVRGTGAVVNATYSAIDLTGQTGQNVISGPGTGNIVDDPGFANSADAIGPDGCWMSYDDGLRPEFSSPCVNTGDNTNIHSTDLAGNPRVFDAIVDMGAYEIEPLGSISSIDKASELIVYPNPATSHLFVKKQEYSNFQYVIYSLDGAIHTIDPSEVNTGEYVLDISSLSSGLYLLVARTQEDEQPIYTRFVKQ